MISEEKQSEFRKQIINAVFVPSILTLLMVLTFLFEKGMDLDFHSAGILPRSFKNLWGIFTYIFIHADLSHLFNNIISFFVLSVSLFYFYRPIALKILFLSYLISGILLWFIGRDSWHIGASGLIYALAFFLFFSGLIRKHIPLIAISFFVTFLYGSMIWHVFPWKINDPVSWEGHLSGGFSGFLLALFYRNKGPQKPEKIWEEDENDVEFESEEDLPEISNTDNTNQKNYNNT